MTKDVLVSIKGLQFSDGEGPDKVETINSGQYYKKGEHHYILFDEVTEGYNQPTKNMIKFGDGLCSVNKKGLINVNMLFEERKKNLTSYTTPYGNIMIGIDTARVDLLEKEDKIDISVDYALEANYEHLADCKLSIEIRNKNEGIPLA